MKPEPLTDRRQQIGEVAFRRLVGEFRPHATLTCDAGSFDADGVFVECGKPAICRVGGGADHPSCEHHARGESYVWPLDEEE